MKSPDGLRECSAIHNHQRIVLSGKHTTKVCLLNPGLLTVEQIEVDGCAITEGIRCDWLLRLPNTTAHGEVFVELKGSGISHAIEQLRESITKLSAQKNTLKKKAIIVFSRNPKDGTDIQNYKAKFLKNFNASLLIVRDKMEIPL